MKKFVEKKKLDWKFNKAGEGHALSEEKSLPSQPSSKPSEFKVYLAPNPLVSLSGARAVPSSSSQSAGSAALARIEALDRKGKPSSRSGRGAASLGSVASSSDSSTRDSETVRKKPCSQPPDREEPVPMEVRCNSVPEEARHATKC